MNYPFKLGEVGKTMAIPLTHSYHNYTTSNVWLDFGTSQFGDGSIITTYLGANPGTNNFYLTTKNNVAMIQRAIL